MTEPLIIMVAPNGARRSTADHPALPITATALAETARRCMEAGASVLHMHVRDPQGRHTLDPRTYREAIALVREATDDKMLIQITSEAAGIYGPREQMAAVREANPEAVSIAMREIFAGDEAEAGAFLADLHSADTLIQYILYSPEEVTRFHALRNKGALPNGRVSVLFVLGSYGEGKEGVPEDLPPFLEAWRKEARVGDNWTVCAFGRKEQACVSAAAAEGGHVRVGFENNLWLDGGQRAASNEDLVARVAATARALGRPLTDGRGAKEIMAA